MNRRVMSILLPLGLSAICCSAELIENGDFSKGVNYWRINRHTGYVPTPNIKVSGGVLKFNKLSPLSAGYLTLGTVVNIRKGKKYKLSYDIKGPAKGSYSLKIGENAVRDKKKDKKSKASYHYTATGKKAMKGVPAEWTTVEAEFVGKHDTMKRWFEKSRAALKSSKLKDDRTGKIDKKQSAGDEVDFDDRPCMSRVGFWLGSLEGELSLRNISIVEVE